jgi:transcriptional regulator with XRE-family HTH domain
VWINPDDYKIVGEVLAATRRNANISQDRLAAALGKPQSFISLYEQGQRRIDLLEFLRIIDALGADATKVFDEIARKYAI